MRKYEAISAFYEVAPAAAHLSGMWTPTQKRAVRTRVWMHQPDLPVAGTPRRSWSRKHPRQVSWRIWWPPRSRGDGTPHRLRVRSAVARVAVGVRLPTEAVGLSAQAECHLKFR